MGEVLEEAELWWCEEVDKVEMREQGDTDCETSIKKKKKKSVAVFPTTVHTIVIKITLLMRQGAVPLKSYNVYILWQNVTKFAWLFL